MKIFPPAASHPKHLIIPALAVAAAILFGSCARGDSAPIVLRDSDGTEIAMKIVAGMPEEGSLALTADRPARAFLLEKPVEPDAGSMLAVTVDAAKAGIVLDFSTGSSASRTGKVSSFASFKGEAVYILELPAGRPLKYISIGARVAEENAGDDARDPAVSASIRSMELIPWFRGFEQEPGRQPRVSGGIARGSGGNEKAEAWILDPPGSSLSGTEAYSLLLRYGARTDRDIRIGSGDVALRLRASNPDVATRIPLRVLGSDGVSALQVEFPEGSAPLSLSLSRVASGMGDSSTVAASGDPLPVDPGVVLLATETKLPGDYAAYAWDRHPEVLILDFADYATQDAYLKRLAFFVEKKGFAGRLATDTEIASLHGWNAHDYKASDLARFFSLAAEKDFPLNVQELTLRDLLIRTGILERKGRSFSGSTGSGSGGALISITRESPAYLRHLFLTHELSHAIFFVDEEYRNFCSALWKSMPAEEKWFYLLYFGWMNYDTSSASLMAAELQAYLVQQPVASATEYFTKTLPDRLLENHPELQSPIQVYMETYGASFEARAGEVDSWLKGKYGFGAGTAFLLR